VTTY